MVLVISILLAAVLAILGILHVYWALGGHTGYAATIPTIGGRRLFNPSTKTTLAVSAAMFIAMVTILGRVGIFGSILGRWFFYWGTWGIALVFSLRAVGEFRYVGFFKCVRNTSFANSDTWLYSPLCLVIAICAAIVAGSSS